MLNSVKEFLNYIENERNYSQHTITAYQNDLKQFYIFLSKEEKNIRFEKIQKDDVKNFLALLFENGVSKKSISRKLASLRSYFHFLIRTEKIKSNPTLGVKSPKKEKRLPQFLDEATVNKLLDLPSAETVEGIRDRAILEILYSSGLRRMEVVSLKISDINFHSQTIKVFGKWQKDRIIPFGKIASLRLNDYLKIRKSENKVLFVNDEGGNLSTQKLYNIVKKYMSKCVEINQKSPHVLRHTFATHLLNRGADIRVVKELLGHEDLSSTQIYTHVTTDKLKKIYQQSHPKATN